VTVRYPERLQVVTLLPSTPQLEEMASSSATGVLEISKLLLQAQETCFSQEIFEMVGNHWLVVVDIMRGAFRVCSLFLFLLSLSLSLSLLSLLLSNSCPLALFPLQLGVVL
jgi:hypothetical protein